MSRWFCVWLHPCRRLGALNISLALTETSISQCETVLLDFRTDCCIACARHASIIYTLKEQNLALCEAITYIVVNCDTYGESGMPEKQRVTQNGTSLLFRGSRELGRIEGAGAIKDIA